MYKAIVPQQCNPLFKTLKKLVSVFVCLVLCVSLVLGTSYRKPAHAGVVTYVAEAVLAALAAKALGVAVSAALGDQDATNFYQSLYDSVKADFDQAVYVVEEGTANFQHKIQMSTAFIRAIGMKIQGLWNAAPAKTFTELEFRSFDGDPYSRDEATSYFAENLDHDVLYINYFTNMGFDSDRIFGIKLLSQFSVPTGTQLSTTYKDVAFSGTATKDNCIYAGFLLMRYKTSVPGDYLCFYEFANPYEPNYNVFVNVGPMIESSSGESPLDELRREHLYLEGKSILAGDNTVDSVLDAVKSRAGSRTDALPADAESVEVNNVGANERLDANTRAQSQTDTLDTEIATDADYATADAVNAATGAASARPMDFPDISIPQMILQKFPFCLPWDIYNAVHVLVAPGVAPVWNIPFHIQSIGFDQTLTIDMSDYQTLANITRWGISVLFLVGLIFATRKLIWR